jgi:hypothetical protein
MSAASPSPADPRSASCALLHRPRTGNGAVAAGAGRGSPILAHVAGVRRQRTESLTQSYLGITERTARLGSYCGFIATSRRVHRIMSPASPFPSNLQPSIRAGQTLTWTAVDSPEHARTATQVATHVARLHLPWNCPRDHPHRARDGPRPVRAGSPSRITVPSARVSGGDTRSERQRPALRELVHLVTRHLRERAAAVGVTDQQRQGADRPGEAAGRAGELPSALLGRHVTWGKRPTVRIWGCTWGTCVLTLKPVLRHGDDDLAACVPLLHAPQTLGRAGQRGTSGPGPV